MVIEILWVCVWTLTPVKAELFPGGCVSVGRGLGRPCKWGKQLVRKPVPCGKSPALGDGPAAWVPLTPSVASPCSPCFTKDWKDTRDLDSPCVISG